MALFGVGVAPGDHEDLLALVDEPFDHAAAGGEVEHVVLVDRRRREQQRHLADLLGLRRVLDQLEHVGAQHDRARGEREVLADRELGGVDGGGKTREVAREATGPLDEVGAPLVDALLDHARVRPREVARRERVEHVARGEAGLALVAPVELGVGDQAVHRLAHGHVRLQQPPEQPAGFPRRVGEAPVALGRANLRAPARDPGQLDAQTTDPTRRAIGPAREARGDPHGGSGTDEARASSARGVGEHHVQRVIGRLGAAAWAALAGGLRHLLITCTLTRCHSAPDSRGSRPRSHPASVLNFPPSGCELITGAARLTAGRVRPRRGTRGSDRRRSAARRGGRGARRP